MAIKELGLKEERRNPKWIGKKTMWQRCLNSKRLRVKRLKGDPFYSQKRWALGQNIKRSRHSIATAL
jgi:hypothetical protein